MNYVTKQKINYYIKEVIFETMSIFLREQQFGFWWKFNVVLKVDDCVQKIIRDILEKILNLWSNKSFKVNTMYIMYYLCLLYTLNELNSKSKRKLKTIYFDTLLCSIELQK